MVLAGLGRWLGGILFFFGLISFITLYAANNSGVLSPQYLNSAIGQIANASSSCSSIGGIGSSCTANNTEVSQIESALSQFSTNNPGCNLGCLLTQELSQASLTANKTGVSVPLSTSDTGLYQIIAEVVAVIGAVLIFFSYEGSKKLSALGRGFLSVSIISFVSTYIPLVYVFPYLLSNLTLDGFKLSIPASVTAPFTSLVLNLDIIFAIVGIVLIAIKYVAFRKKPAPTQLPMTQLSTGNQNNV